MRNTKYIFDHTDKILRVVHVEDVEPHIDECTNDRVSLNNGFSKSKNWRKIGSIPNIILDKWFQEGFNALENSPEARRELRRRLNNGFEKFRTVDKRV